MQKNVFDYLEYSFTKLFSKEWANIIGSSLIISVIAGMLGLIIMVGWWLFLLSPIGTTLSTESVDIPLILANILTVSLFILTVMLISQAWQAIVIPIRSIDPVKHFDWRGDLALFREHFWRYMGYITWYSLLMLVVWIVYLVTLVIVSAVDGWLGVLFGIGGFIAILYMMTLFYVTWYHVLSEGSSGWRMFWDSRKFVRGKAWSVFWKVFFFSLIVGIVSQTILSSLYGILSWDVTGGAWDRIAIELAKKENPPLLMISQIFAIIQSHPAGIFGSWLLMTLVFSLSSVLSKAMFHIFYVRYYLDLRDEWEWTQKEL
jgi:hypothetical protein